jgi:hypothetical protein
MSIYSTYTSISASSTISDTIVWQY